MKDITLEQVLGKLDMSRLNENDKAYLDKLLTLVERDGLTGIYNRRKFDEDLNAAIAKAERYGKPVSLIMIDVDDFKRYNDTYGHPAGDDLLKDITGIMESSLRAEEKHSLYRYGGEEFAIILSDTTLEAAAKVADRLRMKIMNNEFPTAISRRTISMGVSNYQSTCNNPAELLRTADEAL